MERSTEELVVWLVSLPQDGILKETFCYEFPQGEGLKGKTLAEVLVAAALDINNGDPQKAKDYIQSVFKIS